MDSNNIDLVPFGTKSNRVDCAFVWIYARNCTPYNNYDLVDIPNVSLVLTELRFDGLLGGVGGLVENDDISFAHAVQREAKEEINCDLDINKLEPMLTIRSPNGTHNHSFSYEVSYEEIQKIRNNAYLGVHFSAENAGVNLAHICRYTKGRGTECGYNILMKQQFIGTSKIELEHLIQSKNLLIDYLNQ